MGDRWHANLSITLVTCILMSLGVLYARAASTAEERPLLLALLIASLQDARPLARTSEYYTCHLYTYYIVGGVLRTRRLNC